MAINKKLIHFNKKSDFNTKSKATSATDTSADILYSSIVFIKDTQEIWTHGQFYKSPYTQDELEALFENTIKRSEMGVADGVATLDTSGKIPADQLPSYVDDIIDVYATYDKSPTGVLSNITLYSDASHTLLITGEAGKIYQNVAEGEPGYLFRWTGTVFSLTGASSLIIGELTGTAYDGAKGKAAADAIAAHKIDKDNPHEVTKEQVGLSNVDNTSDVDKPVSTLQLAAIADAKKAGTDAQAAIAALGTGATSTDGTNVQVKVTQAAGKVTAVNITTDNTAKNSDLTAEVTRATAAETAIQNALNDHKDNKDKKHIPAGGHERLILAWESDGTAKWNDVANMFTGLEELLAYGVEWKDDVADPHLTRIGNMSLHKTLPIQSKLKGCIALGSKIIYWLDEDDWNFKAGCRIEAPENTYIYPPDTKETNKSVKELSNGDRLVTLPLSGKLEGVPYKEGDLLRVESLNLSGYYFYVEVQEFTDEKLVLLFRYDAYDEDVTLTRPYNLPCDGIILNSYGTPARLDGYDGTVRVHCPDFYIKSQSIGDIHRVWISTVNIDDTWTHLPEVLIDAYKCTALNEVPENMGYLSTLSTGLYISIANTNEYCKGTGGQPGPGTTEFPDHITISSLGKPLGIDRSSDTSTGLYYEPYKNIFYWLWVIEYANFNSTEDFLEELTEDGYHQGGQGRSGVGNYEYNWGRPSILCGYTNKLGNKTGVVLIFRPLYNGIDGTEYESTIGMSYRWRGFEMPVGDGRMYLNGIRNDNGDIYISLYPGGDEILAGTVVMKGGYIKSFDLGTSAHIIPNEIGGSLTTYKCGRVYRFYSDNNFMQFVGDSGMSELGSLCTFGQFAGAWGEEEPIFIRTMAYLN